MREIFFKKNSERLGEARRNSGGVRAARAEMGAMGVMGGWGGSGENSPRLTYSAIADNPKGGQAGKWRLRGGGLRIKNNFY